MHCTSFITDPSSSSPSVDEDREKEGDMLVSVATLITEGRIPGGTGPRKFYEGPHCTLIKEVADRGHKCDVADNLCMRFKNDKKTILNFSRNSVPLCVEVLLTCPCKKINGITGGSMENVHMLEQWHFSISKRSIDSSSYSPPPLFTLLQLVSAIRSQLYFSQITAWLTTQDKSSSGSRIAEDNFQYHLCAPGKSAAMPKFYLSAIKHDFPATNLGDGSVMNVSFFSVPRSGVAVPPDITCDNCLRREKKRIGVIMGSCNQMPCSMDLDRLVLDDRMHPVCNLKGKHRCEDFEEDERIKVNTQLIKRLCQNNKSACEASTSRLTKPKLKVHNGCENKNLSPQVNQRVKNLMELLDSDSDDDLSKDKGQLLLEAIERSGANKKAMDESDNAKCDKPSDRDIFSIRQKNNFNIYVDKHCDTPIPILRHKQMREISNVDIAKLKNSTVRQKITFDDLKPEKKEKIKEEVKEVGVPSASEQAKFRKNLDNAASMVFHSRTGLPLTSSPAPVRKGKTCFDFDSSLNSVSAIKSALFSTSFSTDDDSESDGCSSCSSLSPRSPGDLLPISVGAPPPFDKYRPKKGQNAPASGLLGSFEESVLNGRLEPVSTVHGFTAELGASGSFVPKHLVLPVTVFFYTLGDNDKVSAPYLGHINLGKKGYNVPKRGTLQVTLFNPLGTVIKMFVIMYDLSDMPPNSQTFIRQRTLYMPMNCKDTNIEWGPKWLRYLIHLRFQSSKSGKIYLHTDIRMIIFRKSDMDTATAHGIDMSYELRSFTHIPVNPKFSPRK
ncbi:unnamed protein product [Acanthoscelides obtectus]|uniref:Atos-like conserved domain-containing protein n=1 Tax=Acanthoscelides obtectus TaxID=200917 RepID=A0A9P0PBF0_ACAOB|nr:unnamed protein product [Acanthoscelides obtectus]CAK1671642.1 Protein FAM214A [Acanthoscelides obtectus]